MKQYQASVSRQFSARQKASLLWNAHRLSQEEDGVMVGFSIILVIMMITIGGIGADIMLAEMRRTQLQHTLDRAILAAADLDQIRPATEVVEDYFTKSGVRHTLNEVVVDQSINHRTVTANAAVESNMVYSTVGRNVKSLWPNRPANGTYTQAEIDALAATIDHGPTFNLAAAGTAEERIGNIEISMVLDVSGSMGNNSRLPNLKTAAKEFIQTMADTTEQDTLSISIVPYSAQVSTPDEVMAALTTSGSNPVANCLNFDAADFNETAINPSRSYDQTLHFTWSSSTTDKRDDGVVVSGSRVDCRHESSRELALMQNDTQALQDYIDDFFASGNTSIDTAMKWGTALLDPAFQPVVSNIIADSGNIPEIFEGRPFDYGSNESLKIVVLMSDGQNTVQHYIEDGYREGDSPVWYNAQEDFYSIYLGRDEEDKDGDFDTDEPMYFWPSEELYVDHAYGEGTYEQTEWVDTDECESWKWSRRNGWRCSNYVQIASTVTVNEPGHAEVVTYPSLWAYSFPGYIAEYIYRPLVGSNAAWDEWYYDAIQDTSYGTKDARTRSICTAAKETGIIVYTIGFEAPNAARVVLQDCASSDSHYFDVQGLEIRDAFAAIATSIRQLRLVQ
jgi:hypothetical protein